MRLHWLLVVCILASACQPVSGTTGVTCLDLGCKELRQTCLEATDLREDASCGACIEGTTPNMDDICVPVTTLRLDRNVYPVPWGRLANLGGTTEMATPNNRSVFPVHPSAIVGTIDTASETLGPGDLMIHVQIDQPILNQSSTEKDTIAIDNNGNVGPIAIKVNRGEATMVLAYAGGAITNLKGHIDAHGDAAMDGNLEQIRQLGPVVETAENSGVFSFSLAIRYTDGPASSECPQTQTNGFAAGDNADVLGPVTSRFDEVPSSGSFCILTGDTLMVEYADPLGTTAPTITSSALFNLRNGQLQSDAGVYLIQSVATLTVIEPDWDLDSQVAESYTFDVLQWDSDAATISMGPLGGSTANFEAAGVELAETGPSTGIFQAQVRIPEVLQSDRLERGEEIVLEYVDWGPSGSRFVGEENEDVNLQLFTSNSGATITLDEKEYTWTDKVRIEIEAPTHNLDENLVETIGRSDLNPIKISTRGADLENYGLVETGPGTGVFVGDIVLTGFASHDADGDGAAGDARGITGNGAGGTPIGPSDGFLTADKDDGINVSFEFSEDETVVRSALIRWNEATVQWLEANYPANGQGVIRVNDADMNLDPEAIDNIAVDVWSDNDPNGTTVTATETDIETGIFEATVFFSTSAPSSGHRLNVATGNTVTAEYEDNTLPTAANTLDIDDTTQVN